MMGLGHIRAAWPLRNLSGQPVLLYGSRSATPKSEYKTWRKIKKMYYLVSRAGAIPIIGKYIMAPMLALQRIEPYYPVQDLSRPNFAVQWLDRLIKRKGLCSALTASMKEDDASAIHTFYATAIAMDNERPRSNASENWLLITDTDFNRVWAPKNPADSAIRYLAPCTQVKRRLLTYGVKEENIHLTGFPLPIENIGDRVEMEILRHDLWERLVRLDPQRNFFPLHQPSIQHWLRQDDTLPEHVQPFTLMFAIGGSGAQIHLAEKIVKCLKNRIINDEIRLILSVGIQKQICKRLLAHIHAQGLSHRLDNGVSVIFNADVALYMEQFNQALRKTDVLWTKPSELVFYSALGIPIIVAPPIGAHEKMNRRWLQEIHAGMKAPGPVHHADEWLFDLRDTGRLAEMAWDGFLKGRKLGTFFIGDLVQTGVFSVGHGPMER